MRCKTRGKTINMNDVSPFHGKRIIDPRRNFGCRYSPNFDHSNVKSSQRQQITEMIEAVLIPIT